MARPLYFASLMATVAGYESQTESLACFATLTVLVACFETPTE